MNPPPAAPSDTGNLARRALALAAGPPHPAATRQAQLLLLDALGLMLSGYGTEHGRIITRFAALDGGTPRATIVGYGTRSDPAHAALANGVLCYTHDYADTLLASVVHGEPAVIPAALAVAEAERRNGAALLAAVVAGYEVLARIGLAINGAAHRMALHDLGYHPTALCGTFGAATAAGLLLGLDETALTHALGLAASFAGGTLEPLTATPVTHARRLSGGQAALAGIQAARLAQCGFTAPHSALEGRHGFLRACTADRYDRTPLGAAVAGEAPLILDVAIKYRNCIHAAATPIDALLGLLQAHPVPPARIAQIEVTLPGAHHALLAGRPGSERPRSYGEAQTSLAYCIAAACLHGELAVEQFSAACLHDATLLALAARVSARPDAALDAAFQAGAWPAAVTLRRDDGRAFSARLDHPKGAPQNPLDFAEVTAKFTSTCGTTLDAPRRAALADAVRGLATAPDLDALLALTVAATPAG
jgi:2-methylcitrate dehydratase PrpD